MKTIVSPRLLFSNCVVFTFSDQSNFSLSSCEEARTSVEWFMGTLLGDAALVFSGFLHSQSETAPQGMKFHFYGYCFSLLRVDHILEQFLRYGEKTESIKKYLPLEK